LNVPMQEDFLLELKVNGQEIRKRFFYW
jgi:hypothetical protein